MSRVSANLVLQTKIDWIPVQLTEIVLEHSDLSFSCASEPSVLEVAGSSACRARIAPCLSRPFHQTLSCLSNPFPERKMHTFCTRKLIKHNSLSYFTKYGVWWLIDRFVTFRPRGHGFKSRSSCHIGTLDKSFTRSCLWRFSTKLWHIIRAVGSASE